MKGCDYFRELIDEALKPDVLSFEVSEHIGRCGECERFANERTALRMLVASGTRVTAPANFDAVLKMRLAEAKARPAFSWFTPAGYLRLGAATAGLVVMIFAGQYAGLFSSKPAVVSQGPKSPTVPAPPSKTQDDRIMPPSEAIPIEIAESASNDPSRRSFVGRRGVVAVSTRVTPAGYLTAEGSGVVLVRGENGAMDVPMPTVSVGAQPLLYVSAGQRTARGSVGTSF